MNASAKNKNNGLAQTASGPLSKKVSVVTIGALEAALLKKFPEADGEEWDQCGILVGSPAALIKKVAIALDPTVEAIEEAHLLGANVLLTHHPAFRDGPTSFGPYDSALQSPGAPVWAAIARGVALMCFHTALDVSLEAARVLPGMLNLKYTGPLLPLATNKRKGYGQRCVPKPEDEALSVGQLGARCTSVFGRQPRVWGNFSAPLKKIATCTGSAGNLPEICVQEGIDCLICGEINYHVALNMSQAGIAVIDLGHDTTELPLVALLAKTLVDVGIPPEMSVIIEQKTNWTYPESTRI
jgi:putative NIF3 family GTP cyclohydrolase 1 type 2